MSDDFLEEDDDGLIESKSARKRQMHALQNLGEQLVDLSAAQLAKLNIDNEALIEAVQLAQRISHRSGRRRQMQFIGKLMRSADAEQIADALDALHVVAHGLVQDHLAVQLLGQRVEPLGDHRGEPAELLPSVSAR